MKNPFRFYKAQSSITRMPYAPPSPDPAPPPKKPEPHHEAPPDDFVEWCRTRVRGGIERRERNDIFEAYSVFGTDPGGALLCRYYHRYPEHERDFDLSYTRTLSFVDFNKRLLSELDKDSLSLSDYHACIDRARQLAAVEASPDPDPIGLSEAQTAALRDFCDSLDNLKEKEYRTQNGVFYCSCMSVVGDESLGIRFRKLLPHDALGSEVAGVSRTPIEGYDIENLWIMGIYNRLSERCNRCTVMRLKSEWTLGGENVFLFTIPDFPAVSGTLLIAVSDPASMSHFGFYSLDFSSK